MVEHPSHSHTATEAEGTTVFLVCQSSCLDLPSPYGLLWHLVRLLPFSEPSLSSCRAQTRLPWAVGRILHSLAGFTLSPHRFPRSSKIPSPSRHRGWRSLDYKTISFVDRKFFAGCEQQEKRKGSSELRARWKPPEGENPIAVFEASRPVCAEPSRALWARPTPAPPALSTHSSSRLLCKTARLLASVHPDRPSVVPAQLWQHAGLACCLLLTLHRNRTRQLPARRGGGWGRESPPAFLRRCCPSCQPCSEAQPCLKSPREALTCNTRTSLMQSQVLLSVVAPSSSTCVPAPELFIAPKPSLPPNLLLPPHGFAIGFCSRSSSAVFISSSATCRVRYRSQSKEGAEMGDMGWKGGAENPFLHTRIATEPVPYFWAAAWVFRHLHRVSVCEFQAVMCTSAHLERCYNAWTQTIAGDGPTCWGSAHPSTYSSADRQGFLHQLIAAISAFPVLSTWNHREEGIEPFPSLFTLPRCTASEETPACSSPSQLHHKPLGSSMPSHCTTAACRYWSSWSLQLGWQGSEEPGRKGMGAREGLRSAPGGSARDWCGMWQELRRKHRVWKNREEKDCFGGE